METMTYFVLKFLLSFFVAAGFFSLNKFNMYPEKRIFCRHCGTYFQYAYERLLPRMGAWRGGGAFRFPRSGYFRHCPFQYYVSSRLVAGARSLFLCGRDSRDEIVQK